MLVVGELSDMFGNRGMGRFGSPHGLLANANMLMANQMAGIRPGAGLLPMNPSMGMSRPGGFSMNNRRNMPPQARDAVIDILVIF